MRLNSWAPPPEINQSVNPFPAHLRNNLFQACPSPSPTWGPSLTSSSSPPWWCRTPTRTTPRKPGFPTRIVSSLGTISFGLQHEWTLLVSLGLMQRKGGRFEDFIVILIIFITQRFGCLMFPNVNYRHIQIKRGKKIFTLLISHMF